MKRLNTFENPVFPKARKISRLLEAVAVFDYTVTMHAATARNDGERGLIHSLINVSHDIDTTHITSAGPQKEGAFMGRLSANLGPAQRSYAGPLHLERWYTPGWL